MTRGVTVLGSTGTVGVQALDVVAAHADRLRVVGLAAGKSSARLAQQVEATSPEVVALADPASACDALRAACRRVGARLLEGPDGVVEVARNDGGDVVLAAIVGAAGLPATAAAVRRGAVVALANKESLVVAGQALTRSAAESGARLLPVDSEHAAIHQCLRAGRSEEVRRLVLTASGGPFRSLPAERLAAVTVEEALDHPTWDMGAKITIDSATLMNKGLEVIEACWLFGLPSERVDVVIHPQSIVHSLVEFRDGAVIAQLNLPDMRDPIRYCLGYPERWESGTPPLDLASVSPLEFEPPDEVRFPCLALAREAQRRGGGAPAVLNAANEVAVAAFLAREVGFTAVPRIVERALAEAADLQAETLEEALEADAAGREAARRAVAASAGGAP